MEKRKRESPTYVADGLQGRPMIRAFPFARGVRVARSHRYEQKVSPREARGELFSTRREFAVSNFAPLPSTAVTGITTKVERSVGREGAKGGHFLILTARGPLWGLFGTPSDWPKASKSTADLFIDWQFPGTRRF